MAIRLELRNLPLTGDAASDDVRLAGTCMLGTNLPSLLALSAAVTSEEVVAKPPARLGDALSSVMMQSAFEKSFRKYS